MMRNWLLLPLLFLLSVITLTGCKERDIYQPWSPEKANRWYNHTDWLVGCNFTPSTAINQLEMWQVDTYDPATIDKELGWAEDLGFNAIRVYLHYLVWQENPKAFKERLDHFLNIAHSHNIKTILVLFDDCWNKSPRLGKQPDPIPGVHNSGWMQCPGQKEVTDTTLFPVFEDYTKDIVTSFGEDKRVVFWDLYNEPGNEDHGIETLPLLKKTFQWAREAKPEQPITSGVWSTLKDFKEINEFLLAKSDIITYHDYSGIKSSRKRVAGFRKYNRPLICTEYLARIKESNFKSHLPFFKKEKIGAINWGLVSGKTQTIFPWGSLEGTPEPEIWYHDIFHKNGTPFDSTEVAFIKTTIKGD